MTRFLYPIDLTVDEDGRTVARLPDIPGCVSDGADEAEALTEIADALEESLAHYILNNEAAPAPSPARDRPCVSAATVIAAKIALVDVMRETGTTNTALSRTLKVGENEVRRMRDPHHATKIDRLELALGALGRRVVVSIDAA